MKVTLESFIESTAKLGCNVHVQAHFGPKQDDGRPSVSYVMSIDCFDGTLGMSARDETLTSTFDKLIEECRNVLDAKVRERHHEIVNYNRILDLLNDIDRVES